MEYTGTVYRPPSEARSLIIQATIGCAHNTCTFCNMYTDKQFRIRPLEEVVDDLREVAGSPYASFFDRVFLADGNALVLSTDHLLTILNEVRALFPHVSRVSAYGTALDVNRKTPAELRQLREAGLEIVYLGAESGDDEILQAVQKGMTAEQMALAGRALAKAGIKCSVTFISGLGGRERIETHAVQSALLTNQMRPAFASFLTLQLPPGTKMHEEERAGRFHRITTEECAEEMRLYLEHVDAEGCVFRMNHASNCFQLSGTLNKDIPSMLRVLQEVRSGERVSRRMGAVEIL